MAYKNRYLFIKRTYPNTIVIFKSKDNKFIAYSDQKQFLKYLKFRELNMLNKLRINYIVVSNMLILEYKTFEDNKYELYYARYNLFKLIDYIHQKRHF